MPPEPLNGNWFNILVLLYFYLGCAVNRRIHHGLTSIHLPHSIDNCILYWLHVLDFIGLRLLIHYVWLWWLTNKHWERKHTFHYMIGSLSAVLWPRLQLKNQPINLVRCKWNKFASLLLCPPTCSPSAHSRYHFSRFVSSLAFPETWTEADLK